MSNRGRHPSHLMVLPFCNRDFEPHCGDIFPEPDGNGSRRQPGIFGEDSDESGASSFPGNDYTLLQTVDRLLIGNPLDLNEIRLRVLELRIGEPMLEGIVVRQEQKPFAVPIQSPNRVDIMGKRSEFCKGLMTRMRGELRDYTIGFIEGVTPWTRISL